MTSQWPLTISLWLGFIICHASGNAVNSTAAPDFSQLAQVVTLSNPEETRGPSSCPVGYYKCWSDDTCIPAEAFCDGIEDCNDKSDEFDYYVLRQISTGLFKQALVPCHPVIRGNGSYTGKFCALWKSWVCDGVTGQCVGDNDENCWQSPSAGCPAALPETLRCNGYLDCPGDIPECPVIEAVNVKKDGPIEDFAECELHGSDEENCTQFRCSGYDLGLTNVTIVTGQFCNDELNCPDGSDECLAYCGKECYCTYMYGLCEGSILCPIKETDCRKCKDGLSDYGISQWCDGVLNCMDGSDEECQLFTCRNGNQISKEHLCDGQDDCGDNSDDCRNLFLCANNKSLLIEQTCDGYDNCGDHSDECFEDLLYASYACKSKDRFMCGSGECIARASFCDGVVDCQDGSDELVRDADNKISSNSVLCNNKINNINKTCVLQQESWMCDLVDHCTDRSDECQADCGRSSFWCDGDKCLRVEDFCNGVPDCEDGSDEAQYTGDDNYIRCSNFLHPENECALSIYHQWACDPLTHCLNGTDQCVPGCSSVFFCESGECIDRDMVCDGEKNCRDGSDERASSEGDTFTCVRTRHPLTHTCILPFSVTEDSVPDCDRDMDVIDRLKVAPSRHGILVDSETTKQSFFRCVGEKRLIPGEKQCDGIFDCVLLSDECMCEQSPALCEQLCYGLSSPPDGAVDPCNKCLVGEVLCDEKCIERRQICDGVADCSDMKDEEFCASYESCTSNKTSCEPNFVCHSQDFTGKNSTARLCDGKPECNRFEDECNHECQKLGALPEFCGKLSPVSSNLMAYDCKSRGVVLKASDVCDGHSWNCPDGEDEDHCPGRIYCNATMWTNSSEVGGFIHISPSQVCDGKIDCKNKMDEEHCSQHFYCDAGDPYFVAMRAVTDGKDDCEDGSDECPANRFSDDVFASREHMIRDPVLRYLIWVMGGLSIAGNLAVLFETLFSLLWAKDKIKNKRPFAKANHVLVINLALADLLMGVYLVILASKATQTSGSYCLEDKSWRSSTSCDFLGSLAVLSCVNSVLILVVLTSYRLYGVLLPYKCSDLSYVTAQCFALLAWTTSFLLAVLPVIAPISSLFKSHVWIRHNPYFQHDIVDRKTLLEFVKKLPLFYNQSVATESPNGSWPHIRAVMINTFGDGTIRGEFGYYSAHSVCLPKFYVTKDDVGWEHSVVIIILNFLAFFYIVVCYGYIYKTANTVKKKSKRQSSMLRRISYLVISDLICWLPICVMAFLNLAGHDVGEQAYAISAVILLPINSALNPLLYSNVIQNFIIRFITCGKKRLDEQSIRSKDGETRNPQSSVKVSSKPGARDYSMKRQRRNGNSDALSKAEKVELIVKKDLADESIITLPCNNEKHCLASDANGTTSTLV